MNSRTTRVMPLGLMTMIPFLILLACIDTPQNCQAASDCDVKVIKVTSVTIGEDRITIKAEASIGMVIITPDFESSDKRPKGSRFTGRLSNRIKIKADQATFVVLRLGKGNVGRDKAWQMSVDAAKALAAGKKIGRIGYYRPDITIKKNRVDSIIGKAYIYPYRGPQGKPVEAAKAKSRSQASKLGKVSSPALVR